MMSTLVKAMAAVKKKQEDKVPSEILPRIFLGSIGAAMSKDVLIEKNITHILVCAANLKPAFPDDFEYCVLKVLDRPE